MAETLIDSYSESNYSYDMDAFGTVSSGSWYQYGQSFTASALPISSCKFYLRKVGSPTGNATAKLYAHTGTFGTDGKPTGSVLATSGNLDVTTLSTSYALITFTFASPYTPTNGTKYVIVLSWDGGTNDANNDIQLGADFTSPSHGGNYSRYVSSAWTGLNNIDICFYVYGTSSFNIAPTMMLVF